MAKMTFCGFADGSIGSLNVYSAKTAREIARQLMMGARALEESDRKRGLDGRGKFKLHLVNGEEDEGEKQ